MIKINENKNKYNKYIKNQIKMNFNLLYKIIINQNNHFLLILNNEIKIKYQLMEK